MSRYAFARRSFLRSVGGALGLRWWLRSAEARAQGAAAPMRLLVIHRPNGTIRSDYLPNGGGAGATLGPILQPFMPLWQNMVVLDGLQVISYPQRDKSHESGLITLMTGSPEGATRPTSNDDDWYNTAPSLDQVLVKQSAPLSAPALKSLQVAAHNHQDSVQEVADRTLSYSGPDQPMYPEIKPTLVYARVFGSLMAGGTTASNLDRLAKARARKQSVLDFARWDLARLGALAPSSERDKIDSYTAAIRDLEQTFDRAAAPPATMPGGGCSKPDGSTLKDNTTSDSYLDAEAVGKQQLALVRAAFACDLTRVVTYMWATSASRLNFEGLFAGMPRISHHAFSHGDLSQAGNARIMTAIERWYAERTAAFLTELKQTPDPGGGTVLDNTLVIYMNEVAVGNTHELTNMPLVLFGGKGVRLQGGRFLQYAGRPTNDMWLSIAPVFGVALGKLGHQSQYTGPLAGLFS
jgi:hypothetical protein